MTRENGARGKSPIRLIRGWWLTKDTTRPDDYPPGAREELIRNRLENDDLRGEVRRLKAELREKQR